MNEHVHTGFGAVLRRRREELGLTLDDLAASTRVRKTYLHALEEENLQLLPGTAYAVGFLRIYARQLGLPVEPLLKTLAGSVPDEDDDESGPGSGQERSFASGKRRRRPRGRRLLWLVVLLCLLLAVWILLQRLEPERAPLPAARVPAVAPAPRPEAGPLSPPPVVTPVPVREQEVASPVEIPVIPAAGAIVRLVPVAEGMAKVALDGQESREYPLQPQQPLNWKVADTLSVEFSLPGLARIWVGDEEVGLSEGTAFLLKKRTPAQGQP